MTRERLPIAQAVALGALHGPAELLPVSSSGHVELVPWLFGWRYSGLDPELRKAFEVVLHAGTAAGLLLALRQELGEELRELDGRGVRMIALSVLPPAVVGFALERPIERRLGTPATTAAGLIAGSVAMAIADRAPQLRGRAEASALDALSLGLAQTCALVPGVSRGGATLAAARFRRFRRVDASRLSRSVALPVIAGATALKTMRLTRSGLPRGTAVPFAAGTGSAFASTLASTWLIARIERDRSLLPYAIYRVLLAALVLTRLRSARSTTMSP